MTDDDRDPPSPGAHEGLFWRKLAHWGASRGPEWWVRYSPPVFGWAAAALVPSARRAVVENLRQIRGEGGPARDARETLETFASYASSLAEVLSNDAPGGPRIPRTTNRGERYFYEAVGHGRGIIMVTAHTGGWDAVGPQFGKRRGLPMMLVMLPERDERARKLHDDARRKAGVSIAHVGSDPLAALPLLRHLRTGGVIALQLDRIGEGMKTRRVRLFDQEAVIPEGALRLSQASGAPVLPVFTARLGYRHYLIELFPSRIVPRHATESDLDGVAQHLADSMTRFLRSHPTQWFQFAPRRPPEDPAGR